MSKVPLFFMVAVAIIAIAASYRYVQQRREKMDNDAAPLLQKRVVVSNKREKVINDRRSRQLPVAKCVMKQASGRKAAGWKWFFVCRRRSIMR